MRRAMEGGVSGFVLKDAPIEVLAGAIRRCAASEEVVELMLAVKLLLIDPFGSRAIRVTLPPGMDPADLAERPDGDALFRAAIATQR